MFDIYEALRSGKSAEDIANEFVNELNSSIQKVEAEKKAEAAAATKEKDATAVADHLNNFIKVYYPEKALTFTGKDIIALIEASVFLNDATAEITKSSSVDEAVDKFTETLSNFFEKYGI